MTFYVFYTFFLWQTTKIQAERDRTCIIGHSGTSRKVQSLTTFLFSLSSIAPKKFVIHYIILERMDAKFHWFMAFYIFFMYFRCKNTKIQVERDAMCIRCRNSFKFCIYDQHGLAHLLAKFYVILFIPKIRPYS